MSLISETNTKAGDQMQGVYDAIESGGHRQVDALMRAFAALDAATDPKSYANALTDFMEAHYQLDLWVGRINSASCRMEMRDAFVAIDIAHPTQAVA